jgi:hypothetical protein
MNKLYFDCEFTGLHQNTQLISIGIVSDNGKKFYAELNNYLPDILDKWLHENVISKLKFNNTSYYLNKTESIYEVKTDMEGLNHHLEVWLSQFDRVEMYSDCLSYDWVLFNNVFGTAFDIPKNIYYIPFDLCSYFKVYGIDPDISREEFSENIDSKSKHNALHDAEVIKQCFDKLLNNKLNSNKLN